MSVLRTVRKRKKVRKLGSVTIIRREAYADLELDAKVELIRSLIPLGLMHVQELLDQEVTALASARYARKDASVSGRRHGSNPGTVGLAGSACRFGCPGFAVWRGARSRCGPMRPCVAIVTWTTCCCGGCCTGFPAATTRPPPRRFPGRLGSRVPRYPGASSRPARRSCGRSRSGTCPVRTWWPCSWTARRLLTRRWSSRWASRWRGRNASWASSKRTRRTPRC